MHPSTAIAFLASFATASVLPRQDTASPGFKLQSRLANGTSMGYFSPTVGGGAWFGVLVDDISEARSLVLTDSNPQKANLMVPKDESDGRYWDIAWVIGGFESDQQELVALTREEDHAWTVGFSIDSDKDNLLSYDGPLSPLLFGACRNIGLYRGSGPQTGLYWKIPGAKHARTEACADLSLHAIFD